MRDHRPRSASEIEAWIITQLSAALRLPASRIDPAGELPALSLDSIRAVELAARASDWLERPVPATILWDHETIRDLATALAGPESV
jgi:phthiocerol/phenolphthiocerol synthesis type-I polyketide synthase D